MHKTCRWVIVFGVLLAVAAFAGFWIGARQTQADNSGAELSNYKVHYFTARTDANGRFEVEHGISQECDPDCDNRIIGMTVSVQNNTNGAWYSLYSQQDGLSRFAWDDVKLSGVIEKESYANSPVRIVVFTTTIVG